MAVPVEDPNRNSVQEKQIIVKAMYDEKIAKEIQIQKSGSHVKQPVPTRAEKRSTTEPCESMKGDTCATSKEISESDSDKTDDLTGQSVEGAHHLPITQANRNIEVPSSTKEKCVKERKNSEKKESEQLHVLDTSGNDKSHVQNSCKPKDTQIPVVTVFGHKEEELITANESPTLIDIALVMVCKLLFGILCTNGSYLVARMIYMLYNLLCPKHVYCLFKKVCMKIVDHSFVLKDLDIIKKRFFSKYDQQKYWDRILGGVSTLLYNQVIQVYAVVANNYVSRVPTHDLDDPIQHPHDPNDAGELAIADQGSPLQLYNQQHPQNGLAGEVLEGPIQHPQQNDAGMLAIADDQRIQHPNNLEQQPNEVVLHANQNQQFALDLGIAFGIAFAVIAVLLKIFFI